MTEVKAPFEYLHIEGDYSDVAAFEKIKTGIRASKRQLFYLALPPQASRETLQSLHMSGIVSDDAIILVEKPFGTGLEDAKSLATYINESFGLEQCLKVDHYAGKKELRICTMVTIKEIAAITVQMFETATVEHRKGFYNEVGELRDVGQNHLLLMLATILKGNGSREEVLSKLCPDSDLSHFRFGRYEGNEGKETLFSVPAHFNDASLGHIKVTLRAGKGVASNDASILLTTHDGTEQKITLSSGHEAYEHILQDALNGCRETFLSDGEVFAAWAFIEAIEKIKEKKEIICYPIGYDQRFFNEENA